jgi:hypothetical protein
MNEKKRQELESRFTYHPPKGDQPERYQKMRDKIKEAACLVAELTPEGREQSLALTHLQNASMWASAAIACGE